MSTVDEFFLEKWYIGVNLNIFCAKTVLEGEGASLLRNQKNQLVIPISGLPKKQVVQTFKNILEICYFIVNSGSLYLKR